MVTAESADGKNQGMHEYVALFFIFKAFNSRQLEWSFQVKTGAIFLEVPSKQKKYLAINDFSNFFCSHEISTSTFAEQISFKATLSRHDSSSPFLLFHRHT